MRFIALLSIFFALTIPAFAKTSTQGDVIRDVERYLNGLRTAESTFVQSGAAAEGVMATGTFYLNRPGRLRFEYAEPFNDVIVADGVMIHFYDDEFESVSDAPIGSTLADFLLRKKISLSDDIKIMSVFRKDKLLHVMLALAEDPEAGSLTLAFHENPLQLAKWSVIDAQGIVTEITLTDFKEDVPLDPALFVFKAPKGMQGYND